MRINPNLLSAGEYTLALSGPKVEAIKQRGIKPINLTMGDPRLPAFSGAAEAVAADLQQNAFYNYPATKGLVELRQSIARWCQRHHSIELDPEREILPTMGSKEAIYHLPALFDWTAAEGKERPLMFFPTPGYPVYRESATIAGIEMRTIALNWEKGYQIEFNAIQPDELQRCQIFWLNYPHNPTGAGAPKELIAELLALAERYDFLLCADECYNDIYFTETPPPSVLDFPDSKHWLLVRSLSKRSHMTGYRCGFYASRNTELLSLMLKMRTPMGVASPNFVQRAAIAAWDDEAHVAALRTWYTTRFSVLREALSKAGFEVFPSVAGFYLWCRYRDWSEQQIVERFFELGVICAGGAAFGASEDNCIRLVFCLPDEELDELCKRLENFSS